MAPMRLRLGDVRRILREEIHGVPEWQFRGDVTDFVERIRHRLERYILTNKSETAGDRREAIAAMNGVCDDLEDSVYDVIDDVLFSFVRRV